MCELAKRVPRPKAQTLTDCGALETKRVPRAELTVPPCGAIEAKCVPRGKLIASPCGALDARCVPRPMLIASPCGALKDFIYFSGDESFDYNGPFGTATHHEIGLHGFSIKFDDSGVPILSSIKGFGMMDDATDNKNSREEFLSWLDENEKYLNMDDEYSTPLSEFEELKENIKCELQK